MLRAVGGNRRQAARQLGIAEGNALSHDHTVQRRLEWLIAKVLPDAPPVTRIGRLAVGPIVLIRGGQEQSASTDEYGVMHHTQADEGMTPGIGLTL